MKRMRDLGPGKKPRNVKFVTMYPGPLLPPSILLLALLLTESATTPLGPGTKASHLAFAHYSASATLRDPYSRGGERTTPVRHGHTLVNLP